MELGGSLLSGKESPPFCCVVTDQNSITCQPFKELAFSEFNSWFLGELGGGAKNLDQALSIWSGSTDSNTLDYQRTNPRGIKSWELTQRKPLEYKSRHHPTSNCTLRRTPHLNNNQNKNTNPIINRKDYHFTQCCPLEEKQTNKQAKTQHKCHPIRIFPKPLDQPKEDRNKKEVRIQHWSLGKGDFKHKKLKKKIMERQRNTTQMKEQTRNTQVQIT